MSIIKIISIDYENGESDMFTAKQKNPVLGDYGDPTLPDLDYDNYHGFLLEEGNVVYIPDGKTLYEQAGVDVLRKLIDRDKFWQLATKPEQAYFYIIYEVQTKGRDHLNPAFLQRREGFTKIPSDLGYFFADYGYIISSEEPNDNIVSAERLYKNILKIQKMINNKKEKIWMRFFVKE